MNQIYDVTVGGLHAALPASLIIGGQCRLLLIIVSVLLVPEIISHIREIMASAR